MHCGRALPEWGPDGSGDESNTKLLHDVAEVVCRGAGAQQMQDARHVRDPAEPEYASMSPGARAALAARVGNIRAALATFVLPAPAVRAR